ncbi:thermostable hemolysin [Marinobacter sp. OP 3.4]|uniref:thermostable hemolysin n=1 Tax=Marinobacter sp. OP 3.4 TaxID=3076501 RepID=UPI002E1FFF4E
MTDPLTMPPALDVTSDEVRPVARFGTRWLCEVRPGTANARRAGDFILRRFRQAYDACPELTLPPLLAMTTEQGTLLAVVGVRRAGDSRLFLEDYLDDPVELCLPGFPSSRSRIVEIAHLAGVEAGVSRHLFITMAPWLEGEAVEWVVCTGTSRLRNGFRLMGIDVADLGPAAPERLPGGGCAWGRYYQHQPRVMAIHVPPGIQKLRSAGALDQVSLLRDAVSHSGQPTRVLGGCHGHIA